MKVNAEFFRRLSRESAILSPPKILSLSFLLLLLCLYLFSVHGRIDQNHHPWDQDEGIFHPDTPYIFLGQHTLALVRGRLCSL